MLDPERTLAIICGASEWPKLPSYDSSPAFSASAEAMREYLRKPPISIPDRNMLWLFDRPDAVGQYDEIARFLASRFSELEAPRGADVTVMFSYVGHGKPLDDDLGLMLSDTREPIVGVTSITAGALASVLRAKAPDSARILILDCCFAGAATHTFQGPLNDVVGAKADQALRADRGVTMMCASSAKNPAKLDLTHGRTMFTGALIDFLCEGDPDLPPSLSVRSVCEMVGRRLSERVGDDVPWPEAHSPKQDGGDLADLPLFPNPAASDAQDQISYSEAATLREGQKRLREALDRTWSIIYPRGDDLDHLKLLDKLDADGLIDRATRGLATDFLALSDEDLDQCRVSQDDAMRLTHFDRTMIDGLSAVCFQKLVVATLKTADWEVQFVEDEHRRRRGWLFDINATRSGEKLLVAPKTATRKDSQLLKDALRRLSEQVSARGVDAAVLVIPQSSAARIPDHAALPILRYDQFTEAINHEKVADVLDTAAG